MYDIEKANELVKLSHRVKDKINNLIKELKNNYIGRYYNLTKGNNRNIIIGKVKAIEYDESYNNINFICDEINYENECNFLNCDTKERMLYEFDNDDNFISKEDFDKTYSSIILEYNRKFNQ